MNIFLSYAFSGEDEQRVAARLAAVTAALTIHAHHVYCFHFDAARQPGQTQAERMHIALANLQKYDTMLVLGTSPRRSEGMLMEVGAAIAMKKRLIYAQHESAHGTTYLPSMADYTFIWNSEQELISRIHEYFKGVS